MRTKFTFSLATAGALLATVAVPMSSGDAPKLDVPTSVESSWAYEAKSVRRPLVAYEAKSVRRPLIAKSDELNDRESA
jgi:hypothetical protein